ncbi:hypothetical protein FOZ63_016593 [Perkinsus olseni]|uniref:Uncharacterized protein n=1 Tax=Perkinsus olseni TaxID=32597 RepID=A0A7J6QPG8_PEROL|nr:hypothetical protein FOZ60_017157 [Perkinsus olseni]KAF4699437.1 hypothetical protein FOZ62_012957 [Perkinsus olseni]KAF4710178.1 hypothetical protein FOZ63_016593 [Perkinsus olseni]
MGSLSDYFYDKHQLHHYAYNSCDWDHYRNWLLSSVHKIAVGPITSLDDAHSRYESLVHHLQEAFIASSRKRRVGRRSEKALYWWDNELRQKRASMKKLYRQGNVQGYRLARNDYRRCISQKKDLAFGTFLRSISDLSDADLYKKIKRTPSLPCRLLENDIDVDATLDRLASHYVGTQNLDDSFSSKSCWS